jgi:hypothetical protein
MVGLLQLQQDRLDALKIVGTRLGQSHGAGNAREQLEGSEAISHLKCKYIICICNDYCTNLK